MKKQTNPLLLHRDYSIAEQRLLEAYAIEVSKHWHELRATDQSLMIGFNAKDLVNSNNYEAVREANRSLRKRECIFDIPEFEDEDVTGLISGFRMGRGDGKIIVSIPTSLVPHYIELAELPYMRYATTFRSEYDRPLYLLNDAIAEILDTTKKHVIEIDGIKIELEPSQAMGKGWLHMKVSDIVRLLKLEGSTTFVGANGEYNFGEIKRHILKPRFSFLSSHTDLRCELSNRQGPVKVSGIDIRVTRQAVAGAGVLSLGLSIYKLWELPEKLFSDKKIADKIAETLTQHDILKLYLAATIQPYLVHNAKTFTRDNRSRRDWSMLIIAAQYPECGYSHPEISHHQRTVKFQQFKKETAA